MALILTDVSSPTHQTVHSLEGYVLPHVLDVVTEFPGTVIALLVREYDQVVQGQPLAKLARRWEAPPTRPDDSIEFVVRAPTSGLVSRCWASVGEAVWPTRPLFSIASSDDVLMVARFARAALPRLRSARTASVFVGGAHRALQASILTIVEAPNAGSQADAEHEVGLVRVVLRLPSAPAEALWPGTPAQVEV